MQTSITAQTPTAPDPDGWDKPTRYSLDLNPDDYRALCREWCRRREAGERATMRGIILEAIRRHVPPAPPGAL